MKIGHILIKRCFVTQLDGPWWWGLSKVCSGMLESARKAQSQTITTQSSNLVEGVTATIMLLSDLWSWLLTAISSSTNTSSISTLSMSKNSTILSTATTTSRPLMIAVEGNIASGKSTFLGLLAERSEVAASYKFTFYMLSKRSILSILYISIHHRWPSFPSLWTSGPMWGGRISSVACERFVIIWLQMSFWDSLELVEFIYSVRVLYHPFATFFTPHFAF